MGQMHFLTALTAALALTFTLFAGCSEDQTATEKTPDGGQGSQGGATSVSICDPGCENICHAETGCQCVCPVSTGGLGH
jgi:hypothetical protein